MRNKIRTLEDCTIEMQLTQGQVAFIDKDDYDLVKSYRWCAFKGGNTFYVSTNIRKADSKWTTLSMHRLITKAPKGMEVDHEDHNGCNNRRGNLRVCTSQQNQMGSKRKKNGGSKYKSVSWHKGTKKWQTHIRINGKINHLGLFHSEIEAALAYDEASRKHFKGYAYLNFAKEGENGLFKYRELEEMKKKEKALI